MGLPAWSERKSGLVDGRIVAHSTAVSWYPKSTGVPYAVSRQHICSLWAGGVGTHVSITLPDGSRGLYQELLFFPLVTWVWGSAGAHASVVGQPQAAEKRHAGSCHGPKGQRGKQAKGQQAKGQQAKGQQAKGRQAKRQQAKGQQARGPNAILTMSIK
jgi:hypothetical protein